LGTPSIFIFSAGAPYDAFATPLDAGALEEICANAMAGAPAMQQKVTKVLHNALQNPPDGALFTIATML